VFVQCLVLLGVNVAHSISSADLAFDGLWLITGLAAGLLGAWIRQLRRVHDESKRPFASAYRLLGELRTVARELPGGLDVDVVGENVLATTLEALGGSRAALLLRTATGSPVVVTTRVTDGSDMVSGTDTIVSMCMGLQQPIQETQPEGSAYPHRICLPLLVGGRPVGAVVVEGKQAALRPEILAAQATLNDDALRLESAVLFADVRALATVEERRRLAREIHDGVAQESASLGYLVDDLARDDCDHNHQSGLHDLRSELTRVVTELRLSVFDLRSGVTTNAGLGSVLSDYVRAVGTGSDLAVHVTLQESPERLRLDIETELLRIAQEAVSNARRHAEAANVWVTCRVSPPFAEIRVEDDGIGNATARQGHFGLNIMSERARRVNADLTIMDRPGGGTTVSAVLKANTPRSTGPLGQNGNDHVVLSPAG